jgi:hypothetical protein
LFSELSFPDSQIPRETIRAYRETHYRVRGSKPTVLTIDAANTILAEMHESNCVASSGFVTACNPFSVLLDDAANADRQRMLAREIERRGWRAVDGVGEHPSNDWPGEPSFLVFGLSLEDAKALGVEFGQNAVVWAGSDAVPRLVLLR